MFCREIRGTALGIFLRGTKGEALVGGLGETLGVTMDANFGQKKYYLKKSFFGIPTLDKLMIFMK